MAILNTADMPKDAYQRILWLNSVREAVDEELEELFAEAYFQARLRGQFEAAVKATGHGLNRALAWTRRINNRNGRQVRWSDGLDRRSTRR